MSEINNWDNYSTVTGTDGDDILWNGASGATILSGAGNDSITNYLGAQNTTILTGAGNDTIDQWGGGTLKIIADDGSTLVRLFRDSSVDVDLLGGSTKLDRTYGGDSEITYHFNGGNATLENYSGGEVIHIDSGLLDAVSTDGDDLILRSGTGTLTLKNMRGRAITIDDLLGTTTKIYAPNNHTPLDTIKRFVASLDDTSKTDVESALKSAIRACSGFYDMQDAIDCFIADCRSINDAERFLVEKCGIILDNRDTGAITGWDAGGMTVKTADSIIREEGEADYPSSTFTKQRVTFTLPSRHSLDDQERLVVQGMYSWWIDSIMDLIEDSYELKFSSSSLNFHSVPVSFYNDSDANETARAGQSLEFNMAKISFDESDRTGGGLDRVLAHEFTHIIQYAAINEELAAKLPQFLQEGWAELTAGRDNYRVGELAATPTMLSGQLRLNTNLSYYYSVDLYDTSYMFMRYLAKHGSDESGATSENLFDDGFYGGANEIVRRDGQAIKFGHDLTFDREVDRYIGVGDASLTIDDGDDVSIWLNGFDGRTYDNITTLDGRSARRDAILAGADRNESITGGAGSSSLWGGFGGDDTLIGGGGRNEFFYLYNNGSDVIENARDDDVINLLNIGLEEINFNGIDVGASSITIGFNDGGSIKVNNGADVVFQLNNGVGFKSDRATGGWRLR